MREVVYLFVIFINPTSIFEPLYYMSSDFKTCFILRPECKFQAYCSREYTDEEIASPKIILHRSGSTDEAGAGTPSSVRKNILFLQNKHLHLENKQYHVI